jgi:hypothetical protein
MQINTMSEVMGAAGGQVSAHEPDGPREGEHRLCELDPAGTGDADKPHAAIPHHEAEELGHGCDAGHAADRGRGELHRFMHQCPGGHDEVDGCCEEDAPGDHETPQVLCRSHTGCGSRLRAA